MNKLATILTYPIPSSKDWYHASGEYNGIPYNSDFATRHQAFMEVARQIAVRMEADEKALEAVVELTKPV